MRYLKKEYLIDSDAIFENKEECNLIDSCKIKSNAFFQVGKKI